MGSMIARMTRPAKEKEEGDIYISLAEMLDPFHVSVSCTYMYYSVADSHLRYVSKEDTEEIKRTLLVIGEWAHMAFAFATGD